MSRSPLFTKDAVLLHTAALFAATLLSVGTVGAAGDRSAGINETAVAEGSWIQEMNANPAAAKLIAANYGADWCQSEVRFFQDRPDYYNVRAGCPTEGTCDVPANRNAYIPNSATPVKTVRLYFNVFANNDGTSPAATTAGIAAQVAQLNADFAPSKIQFTYGMRTVNNTTYRQFADSEESAMKSAYAVSPATQLNFYVVNIQEGYLGVGTFPWDGSQTSTQGGLIIDDNYTGSGQKTATHEVGHCLGLWHTHHGVSEVTACSTCWERADGFEGDITGDFCADTKPTPTNFNCTQPGGTDSCSSTAWGTTHTQNYMGYAPDSCYTLFSTQQMGRMHCWITGALSGWLSSAPTPTPTPTPTATPTATATPTPTATPTTTVLVSGTPSSSTVAQGAWKHYSIFVPTGSASLTVAMTGTNDADLYVRRGAQPTSSLYDFRPYLSGSAETVTANGTSTPVLTANSTYYVSVYGYSATTSSFTLTATVGGSATPTPTPTPTATPTPTPTPTATPTATPGNDAYEADNTLATAKAITVGAAAQTHNINPATDQDWVKFTTTATSNLRIETNGPAGGDGYLRFYNSAGTLITSDDDAGTGLYSLIQSPSRPAGTYYVQVTSYNSASTITGYTVRVTTY